tara:strand:+ start:30 stop:284 length:255 start_codon:yes stop_codon:yes gene_type:complete
MLALLRRIEPLKLLVLMTIATTAAALVKAGCRGATGGVAQMPCNTVVPVLGILHGTDVKIVAGLTLFAYVGLQAYDQLGVRRLF